MTEIASSRLGLEVGSPALGSIGPIATGPGNVLFLADNRSAQIVAVDVGDVGNGPTGPADVKGLDAKLADFLSCPKDEVAIRDLAAQPSTGRVYLAVMRGEQPLLLTIGAEGALEEVELDGIPFASATIDDAPAEDDERLEGRIAFGDDGVEFEHGGIKVRVARDPIRTVTVTDMVYADGVLYVAGASNEEFASTLRRIPFPFESDAESTPLEIFHVSHGKWETHSPIRSFVLYGDHSVLATYTCTPIVQFPLSELQGGTMAKGRTVAELGSMNMPLDLVSYERDGEEYLLVSNTRHPLLKIACRDIESQEPLTEAKEPVGVHREELPHEGVGRMARLEGQVLMLQRDGDGNQHLRSYSSDSI
jgi:hypothetical protein